MSEHAGVMERRYGAPSRARRPLVIAGVMLLAAVGISWVVWAALFHGRPMVQSQLVSFSASGEHSARATFTVVRRTQGVEATCLLRATAADHSIVGELNFSVSSSSPATATIEKTIRTERRATSVDLMGCVTDGQNQRR